MPMHCCTPAEVTQEVNALGLGINGLATMYVAGLLAFLAMLASVVKGVK